MKKITIAIFFLAFLLIRPYSMQSNGLMYGGDDDEYFASASSLVFGQFPSYQKEFDYGPGSPLGSIGPGLMAAPFVFLFSLIDRATGADIVNYRTRKNVERSWTQFGFVFSSNLFFWFTCFLLYKGLRFHFNGRYASLAVIYMILCQGLPLFAFRRPIFSHVYELFLQSLLVFVLLRNIKRKSFELKGFLPAVGVGIIIGLMYLVRYNNIVAAFIWPLVLFCGNRQGINKIRFWRKLGVIYISALILITLFKVLPNIYTNHQGYVGVINDLAKIESLSFYVKRIVHILFGIDWGLVYTTPFIFLAIIAFFMKDFFGKRRLLICLIPILINFYIIIMWRTQGAWYGYRVLMASITPLLVYPLSFMLQKAENKFSKKVNILWVGLSILPLFSMLCFEGNNTNLTLRLVMEYFGRVSWGNNTYQLEVWKTLFFHPLQFLIAIFKAGPLYVIYLGLSSLGYADKLMSFVSDKYPYFDLFVAVKVAILYLMPFLLYWLTRKKFPVNEKNIAVLKAKND